MFETTVELLDRLYVKLDKDKATGFNRDLANEARKRLLQLDHLLKLVRDNEAQEAKAIERMTEAFLRHAKRVDFESVPQPEDTKLSREEGHSMKASLFEMELFTECFYYISHRLLSLLNKGKPILGLKVGFQGARNVRNKLLEHAEGKDSQVFIQSFAWGKEHGPILKAARYAGQEQVFPDKGLYANAAEIRDELEAILYRLLNEPV